MADNLRTGALLTCHATLPCGQHPDFGPAICAGFWHGTATRSPPVVTARTLYSSRPRRDHAGRADDNPNRKLA